MNKKTNSPEETKRIARELIKKENKKPLVISLEGNLGTGKTTFVKGVAEKFGINQIKSPTFLIIKKYPVENSKNYKKLVHIDAYRVPKQEIKKLNLKKILKNPENIVLIEWGSKLKDELPETALRVKLKHGNKKSGRIIKIINEN